MNMILKLNMNMILKLKLILKLNINMNMILNMILTEYLNLILILNENSITNKKPIYNIKELSGLWTVWGDMIGPNKRRTSAKKAPTQPSHWLK